MRNSRIYYTYPMFLLGNFLGAAGFSLFFGGDWLDFLCGGICGIVVELCPEDNTFILETGSEASGKSYIKFDKQAVYQTDAVVEKVAPAPAPVEAPVNEDFADEKVEEATEEKAE